MSLRAIGAILFSVALTVVIIGVANRVPFLSPWIQLALRPRG